MAHKFEVQLPLQFEDFCVLSFGKITASPSYYGADFIWPIGYKSCWHDKVTGSLFTCHVLDNGNGEPVFIIKRSSCSKSPIPCGSTVLCRADLDEYDSGALKLPEIDPGSSLYDIIGDLCFEGSSPSSTWNLLLDNIGDSYEEIIKRDGGVRCYCEHATDLNFLSSVCSMRQVSVDLENFLHSQHCVNVPAVVQGEKEAREFLELLEIWLRGYRFGLDLEFVQEFIEQLSGAGACSGYVLCKDRLLDLSLTISNRKIKIKEEIKDMEPFPVGSFISSRLSSHALGDLLQVHEFLSHFQEALGVEEDCLSFEGLENELLSPCPLTYGLVGGAFQETLEMNCTKHKVDKLTTVHMAVLPWLVSKLLRQIARAFNIVSDAKDTEKKKGKKVKYVKLEMFTINQLTWPEVVRRYILACLLMGGKINSLDTAVGNNTNIIRCLLGDDGIFSGAPAGVAGADMDAQLLGRAVEKVFGKLKRERSILSTGTKVVNSDKHRFDTDFSIPEWAKVLDPVRKLPTNVGSRIRNCVHEALKKNPPDWAKKLLEASIAKDVYKGNASGPTKRAVIDVLKRVSDGSGTALPPGREEIKSSMILSNAVMKKCRVILCQVAGYDTNRVLSDLVGRKFDHDENDLKIIYGCVSRRPLDLRTTVLRLVHGTYGGSHEAFLEDVRELWINLRRSYKNRPSVIKLVNKMSSEFKSRYEKEVATLYSKPSAEIEKELEELLASTEIPKVPWETGICKVCGLNRDDTNVLLCDNEGCNAEYHTYCLTPHLSEIPQGDWFCPTCVPPPKHDNEPEVLQNIFQFVDKNCEETTQFLDIVDALKDKQYWELDADKKIFLVKFLCDELLKTGFIRDFWKEPKQTDNNLVKTHAKANRDADAHPTEEVSKLSLRKDYLGTDSDSRFYWGFPNTSTHHGIIVNDGKNGISCAWHLFQSDEQIKNLIHYLERNDPKREELRNSILKWKESILKNSQQIGTNRVEGETVLLHNSLATKASEFLEAKYSTDLDTKKKPRRKNMAKWHRCECLEPVLPSRYHCVKCHDTFFTNVEFQQHNKCDCGLGLVLQPVEPTGSSHGGLGPVSHDQALFGVPECSLKPIVDCDVLRQLKINLLDMEAALPDGAKRDSRASSEWRSAWCAFVKSANTIFEMVEATMVLETMIKTEYIKKTWWWYWSSMAAAAKTSTISALALRIYTLDAAIDYQKTTTTTSSSGQKESKKRKHAGDKVKEQRKKLKKPEDKQEIKE